MPRQFHVERYNLAQQIWGLVTQTKYARILVKNNSMRRSPCHNAEAVCHRGFNTSAVITAKCTNGDEWHGTRVWYELDAYGWCPAFDIGMAP
jgi:hypothetical protein